MIEDFKMGLKHLFSLHFFNPFTKVKGNIRFSLSFVWLLLPSASCPSARRVADGFYKLKHILASCPTGQAGSPIYYYFY
jgi:hypothetical protein